MLTALITTIGLPHNTELALGICFSGDPRRQSRTLMTPFPVLRADTTTAGLHLERQVKQVPYFPVAETAYSVLRMLTVIVEAR